jgi:NADPH-dependent 7-cyano-7-deazaguanine reductase QueF
VHRCPYADEIDHGAVTIMWGCSGQTVELHSLAEYLGGFADVAQSHEWIAARIAHELGALDGITGVVVKVEFATASLSVGVEVGP